MDILERNNVNIFGNGKALILAHGYGLDQYMWKDKTHQVEAIQAFKSFFQFFNLNCT